MFIPAALALLTFQAANLTVSPQPAKFGPQIHEAISGRLAPVFLFDPNGSPANQGCAFHQSYEFGFTRKAQDTLPAPPENFIAFVQRGGCDFIEKVRVAQQLGAKAVVIGNDYLDVLRSGDRLPITMGSVGKDSSDLDIPAFGIKGREYFEILKLMEAGGVVGESFQGLEVELKPSVQPAKGMHAPTHSLVSSGEESTADEDKGNFALLIYAFVLFVFGSLFGRKLRETTTVQKANAQAYQSVDMGPMAERVMQPSQAQHFDELPPTYEAPSVAEASQVKEGASMP